MNLGFSFSISIGGFQYQKSSSLPPQQSSTDEAKSYTKIIELMRDKPNNFVQQLKEEISNVSNVNLLHKLNHSETDFNLLFHASNEDCHEAVDFLLEKGADPTLVNNKGNCVLHLMAKMGQVEMAKKCCSKLQLVGYNWEMFNFINGGNNIGWTPLMAAAETNQLNFVNWLMSKNASVNIKMKTGWTAMHAAAKNDNWEVVQLLLQNGGDKNIKASHRIFGKNVGVEQVTKGKKTLMILRQY